MNNELDKSPADPLNAVSSKDRVRFLADKLLSKGDEYLSCKLEAGDVDLLSNYSEQGLSINDATLVFDSIETRNQFIAEHHFSALAFNDESIEETWFKKARDIWRHEISSGDKASGRLLALWHRQHDIFAAAAEEIVKAKTHSVFDILHVVQGALPYVQVLDPDSLIALCDAQHEKTKNDLAAGVFFDHLEKRLESEPALCNAILDKLRNGISESTSTLYGSASIGWSHSNSELVVERTLQDTSSGNSVLSSSALWVLGRLVASQQVPESYLQQAAAAIQENAKCDAQSIRTAAIFAMAKAALYIDSLASDLTELAEQGDESALPAVSSLLVRERKKIKDHKYRKRWIMSLARLPMDAKGALDNLDWELSSLIKQGEHKLALSCVEHWLAYRDGHTRIERGFVESLDSTTREIIQNEELLADTLTKWLMSERNQLVSAAAGLLSNLSLHDISDIHFYRPILNQLSDEDLIFLVKRLLGVVTSDKQLISLVLSLLDTKDSQERTFSLVEEILSCEVGIDYPDCTISSLKSLRESSSDESIRQLCDRVITSIEGYLDAIIGLPRIEELRPSPHLVREFEKMRGKEMEKAKEKAEEGSIIRHISNVVTLKAGVAVFSLREGNYTDASPMHSFSHSVTMPRRHVLDAVGHEMQRFLYRVAKRTTE